MRIARTLFPALLLVCAASAQPPYSVSPYQLTYSQDRWSGAQTYPAQILISMPAGTAGAEMYILRVQGYDTSTISFAPASGLVGAGQTASIAVTLKAAKLAAGSYILPVWVQYSKGGWAAVEISLEVTESGEPPADPAPSPDPTPSPSPSPAPTPTVFRTIPHVAAGMDWSTEIEFVNPTGAEASLEVDFYGADGQPAEFPVDGQARSKLTLTVPGNGLSKLLVSDVAAQSLATGSASILLLSGSAVGVSATYQFTGSENAASILIGAAASTLTFCFDNSGDKATGIAIANSTTEAMTVTFTAYDNAGVRLQSWDLPLAAHAHSVFTLTDAASALSGASGVLSLSSTSSGLSGFALLFQGGRFRPMAAY